MPDDEVSSLANQGRDTAVSQSLRVIIDIIGARRCPMRRQPDGHRMLSVGTTPDHENDNTDLDRTTFDMRVVHGRPSGEMSRCSSRSRLTRRPLTSNNTVNMATRIRRTQ